MRQPKPWYRRQTDTWYVQLGKYQVPLAKGKANEKAAHEAYFKLMAARAAAAPPEPDKVTVGRLCDEFLKWSERHHTPDTFAWHRTFLQAFCDAHGRRAAAEVIPHHVTAWLDAHPDWTAGRRHAAYCVKRAFAWGHAQGLLTKNPLAAVAVGRSNRRAGVVTKAAREAILAAVKDRAFRDFLTALQETGCRPSEVARVTAADANLEVGVWVLAEHKTAKKTHKPRVVYLTPVMVALTRRRAAEFPDGPLFRTHKGKRPWTRNAVRCRFMRLREKLPHLGHVVSYHYRHAFVTDALENGVGVAQVAELVGHTSTEMVMRHYSKLSERVEHLREAARKATGG